MQPIILSLENGDHIAVSQIGKITPNKKNGYPSNVFNTDGVLVGQIHSWQVRRLEMAKSFSSAQPGYFIIVERINSDGVASYEKEPVIGWICDCATTMTYPVGLSAFINEQIEETIEDDTMFEDAPYDLSAIVLLCPDGRVRYLRVDYWLDNMEIFKAGFSKRLERKQRARARAKEEQVSDSL
ncbi:hypothetical protein [Methylocystis echinoides]|uniref:hypothetical protein n=1 Tax=Methylocystis echinoides TaxID=29468 RepID=UPI003432767A